MMKNKGFLRFSSLTFLVVLSCVLITGGLLLGTSTAQATTTPTINLVSPVPNEQISATTGYPATFTFLVKDAASYSMTCSLYVDGNFKTSNYFNNLNTNTNFLTYSSVGQHSWYITCGDNGNTLISETRNFTMLPIDNEVPVVSIAPLGIVNEWNNGTFTNNSNPTYSWSATDSSAVSLSCQVSTDNNIDGSAIIKAPGSFSTTSVFAPFTDATSGIPATHHQIKVVCTDQSGNSKTAYRNFNVDTVPPVMSVLGAPASPTITPTHIYAQCIDNNGSGSNGECNGSWASIEFLRTLNPTFSPPYKTLTFNSNPGTCPTDESLYTGPSDFMATSHLWVCSYAKDKAGNGAFSTNPVEVKVDTTAPVITLTTPLTVNLNIGDTFIEPGFTAIDDVSGNITSSIVKGGTFMNTLTAGTFTVTYNVTDAAGNSAAEVIRRVIVSQPQVQNHSISGIVKYYDGVKVIPGVTVILQDSNGNQITTATTDSNGAYQFTNLLDTGNYVIKITSSDASTNGLSSADQIKIGRHIAGLEILDSIYKIVAGDVDNSGNLSSADQIKIGRFIAGLDTTLPSGIWKFYSADASLTPGNYLTTGLTRTYNGLITDLSGQNFVAIKMGDVDNSWVNN